MILMRTRTARMMATVMMPEIANERTAGSKKMMPRIPQMVAIALRAEAFMLDGLFQRPSAATNRRIPNRSLMIIVISFYQLSLFW